jgi:beta-glucanase (GH16 family)
MRQSIIIAAAIGAGSAIAQGIIKCSLEETCPESAPCCSQFGECGVGAYCLGGCDPRMSWSFDACVPAPVCQDSSTRFDSMDSIVDIGEYLGDPADATWIGQGEPRLFNDNLLLTMPKDSHGSLISTATYMWYGNVKARMKTSRGKGVITAFILFSDMKDEVDYEWVGADLEVAQTNYYFQGVLDWTQSENITLSDTFNNFHDYEINWTPDKIEWLVDGQVGRTVDRKDTFNKTTQQFEYPQTPSRVQISLWPGGLPDSPKGTIDWAGGVIDWNHEDVKTAGYYYVTVESVDIKCWNADSAPGTNKGVSYKYKEGAGTNDTVIDGDAPTVLSSLLATGLDMEKGKKDESDNNNNDDKDKNKDDAPATIPGGGSGTSVGNDHSGEEDGTSQAPDNNPAGSFGGGSGGSSAPPPADCDPMQWHSSCASTSSNNDNGGNGGGDNGGSRASASALAIVVAGVALFWL